MILSRGYSQLVPDGNFVTGGFLYCSMPHYAKLQMSEHMDPGYFFSSVVFFAIFIYNITIEIAQGVVLVMKFSLRIMLTRVSESITICHHFPLKCSKHISSLQNPNKLYPPLIPYLHNVIKSLPWEQFSPVYFKTFYKANNPHRRFSQQKLF